MSLLAVQAAAAATSGTWSLSASGSTIMLFKVVHGREGLSGEWDRPTHFDSDRDTFTHVTGPVVVKRARSVRETLQGIELTFDDPRPGATPDVFVIRPLSGGTADVSYIGFGTEPATLTPATGATILGPWKPDHSYVRQVDRPTDAEMTAIFEADQAARQRPDEIDWKVVSAEDRKRRLRTQVLLDQGRLRSGDDFYHAAFVFQHGEEPSDYLKAHALAVIAVARGKPSATWIAAATFDRYLQSMGQPQVYGTQFSNRGGKWTQEPYRRDLISDALRAASRVPPLHEQEAQRLAYERESAEQAGSKR
jgi:hypothetical protein